MVVFDYAVLRQLYDERPVHERFGRLLAEYHLLGTDVRLTEYLLFSPEERYRALLASGKTKIMECIPPPSTPSIGMSNAKYTGKHEPQSISGENIHGIAREYY